MNIKGRYKDILQQDGSIIYNPGWKSNKIVSDYGRFLSALMKKEFLNESFEQSIGLEYMAFGSVNNGEDGFKEMLIRYFQQIEADNTNTAPLIDNNLNQWIWAKKIDNSSDIAYINSDGEITSDEITNQLQIEIKLETSEPSEETLVLNEFSLIAVPNKADGTIDPDNVFMVNYVNHGDITKVSTMELSRTINLTFPLE